MNQEHINPNTLFDSKPYSFSQVVVSKGSRLVHIAGQTSQDKDLNIIGAGDLAVQAKRAFENVRHAMDAVGASVEDVAFIRFYIVNYSVEQLDTIAQATAEFLNGAPAPASTIVGVQGLALPDFLIEIEPVLVMD